MAYVTKDEADDSWRSIIYQLKILAGVADLEVTSEEVRTAERTVISLLKDINATGGSTSTLMSVVADITARDGIEADKRYDGLEIYVQSEGKTYRLIGGIDNANWTLEGGGGSSSSKQQQTYLSVTAGQQKEIVTANETESSIVQIYSYVPGTTGIVNIYCNFNNGDGANFTHDSNFVTFDGQMKLKNSYAVSGTYNTFGAGKMAEISINATDYQKVVSMAVV